MLMKINRGVVLFLCSLIFLCSWITIQNTHRKVATMELSKLVDEYVSELPSLLRAPKEGADWRSYAENKLGSYSWLAAKTEAQREPMVQQLLDFYKNHPQEMDAPLKIEVEKVQLVGEEAGVRTVEVIYSRNGREEEPVTFAFTKVDQQWRLSMTNLPDRLLEGR